MGWRLTGAEQTDIVSHLLSTQRQQQGMQTQATRRRTMDNNNSRTNLRKHHSMRDRRLDLPFP